MWLYVVIHQNLDSIYLLYASRVWLNFNAKYMISWRMPHCSSIDAASTLEQNQEGALSHGFSQTRRELYPVASPKRISVASVITNPNQWSLDLDLTASFCPQQSNSICTIFIISHPYIKVWTLKTGLLFKLHPHFIYVHYLINQ